jgi:hypothetical protein
MSLLWFGMGKAHWIGPEPGAEANDLLGPRLGTISADQLHLPGPDFVPRAVAPVTLA